MYVCKVRMDLEPYIVLVMYMLISTCVVNVGQINLEQIYSRTNIN